MKDSTYSYFLKSRCSSCITSFFWKKCQKGWCKWFIVFRLKHQSSCCYHVRIEKRELLWENQPFTLGCHSQNMYQKKRRYTLMEDLNLVSMVVISHLYFFVTDLLTNLYPAVIYLLKINNRNTRTRCKKCSKLTIKIPEQRLLTLNIFHFLF